jgi:hypothetical protein
MRFGLLAVILLHSSLALARSELEEQMGPFHGNYYTCFEVKYLRNSLADQPRDFKLWSEKELSDLRAFVNTCQAKYRADVSATLPLLDTLKSRIADLDTIDEAKRREEFALQPPLPPPRPVFAGDIGSWTRIPPLPRGLHTQSRERSTRCELQDWDGHMSRVWATEKACADWLAKGRKLDEEGPSPEQIAEFKAKQRVAKIAAMPAIPGTIYAVFFCMRITDSCKMIDGPHMSLNMYMPGTVYNRLSECMEGAQRYSPEYPDEDGRLMNGPDMWYECRSRHIDTWEPVG